MKKLLFLLSVATALASCSNNEVINENEALKGNEISFSTLQRKVNTRYANEGKSNYQVYAKIAGESVWFINNTVTPSASGTDVINPSTSGGTTPSYYWPGNNTNVSFYAFAPAMGSGSSIGEQSVTATPGSSTESASINIEYAALRPGIEDFTIAIPRTQSSGQVDFTFQHMLCLVQVYVQLSSELTTAGYTVNNDFTATLVVPYYKGNINAVYDYSSTTPTPAWTLANDTAYNYTGLDAYIIMPQSYSLTTSTTSGSTTTYDYGNCTIQLGDNLITGSGGTQVFSGELMKYGLKDGDITGNAFEMGKYYKITFTIGEGSKAEDGALIFSEKIVFTSTVADWDDVSTVTSDVDQP